MIRRSVALAFATLMLSACGAGGAGAPAPANAVRPQSASMPVTITIPNASTVARKHPQFIPPNAQSIAVFVWQSPQSAPTTPSATINISSCTPVSGGVSCTLFVTVPFGAVNVRIDADGGPNGTGSTLSTVTTTVTVTQGAAPPPVTVTLGGTPAITRLSLQTPVLSAGAAGTSILNVNAYDASGALITGTGTYTTPITVAADSSAVSLSATSVTAPSAQITVTYNGATSAPYAVHLTGTSGTIPTNSIIGATLDINPPQSLAFISGYSNSPTLSATLVASNSANDAPQVQRLLTNYNTSANSRNAFAYLASGAIVIGNENTTTGKCIYTAYGPGASTTSPPLSISPANDYPYQCPVTGEPNGDVLASDNGGGGDEVTEYSVSAAGVLTPTGRTITLVGSQVPTSSVAPLTMATDAAGDIAMLVTTGSVNYVLVYSAGASGTASPTQTISLASASGTPVSVGIASDGSVAVLYQTFSSGISYRIDRYNLAGTIVGSIVPSISLSNQNASGIAIDASNELLVLDYAYASSSNNYAIEVEAYSGSTFGTIAPNRIIPVGLAPGVASVFAGPVIAPSPAPPGASTTVSGDMFGYVASRTWTYLVTDSSGSSYYIGLYADPNLVNGNIRLVGFQSTTSNPFSGGTKIGTVDFSSLSGNYLAAAFASASSGTSGTSGSVPGTPLFVPSSLTTNQTWNPLANQAIANATGVTATAQVTYAGSNIPNIAACPSGTGTNGATVRYSVSQAAFGYGENASITYVPGCGITQLTTADGTVIALQSVGSMPTLGQQALPAGQPPIVAALHALWRQTLNIVKPKP